MKKYICLSILSILLFAGCAVNSRADYYNNARQLTFATDGCTFAVPILKARGDLAAIASMNTAIHIGHNCSTTWYNYIKDPNNNLPPNIISCAFSAYIEILGLQDQADIDTNTAGDLDTLIMLSEKNLPPDLENAKLEYILVFGPGDEPVKLTDAEITDIMLDRAKADLDVAVLRFDTAVDLFLAPGEVSCVREP